MANFNNTVRYNSYALFLILEILLLSLLLRWLFVQSGNDLNFMDEAFYLNWFKNAPDYNFSTTSFGFVYRPIYLWFDENIISLRYFNVIANYLLGLALTHTLFKKYFKTLNINHITLLFAVSSSALLILIRQDVFLATPSYNTLTFQGAILFCIGLLGLSANQKGNIFFLISVLILTFGGWLVFLGKPTSALLLLMIFLIYLIFSLRTHHIYILGVAIISSMMLVLATSLLIDGSLFKFINRHIVGLRAIELFEAGHTTNFFEMFRHDIGLLVMPQSFLIKLFLISSLISIITYFNLSSSILKKMNRLFTYLSYVLIVFLAFVLLNEIKPTFLYYEFYMLSSLTILFGITVGTKFAKVEYKGETLIISLIFILLPYVLAFGSGNNYWHLMLSASFFWILAGINIILATNKQTMTEAFFMLLSGMILTSSIASLWISANFPKSKLEDISKHAYKSYELHGKYNINLNNKTANYFNQLTKQAELMGFKHGMPILDLTGQYGLAVYVINGKSVGMPMLYGGYAGSNKVADLALEEVECSTLAQSWILYEPDGYRRLSEQLLNKHGLNIKTDYIFSDRFWGLAKKGNPFLYRSRLIRKSNRQYLLKPINPINSNVNFCRNKSNK